MLRRPREIFVTTDALALNWSPDDGLRILLIERLFAPFQGMWALPGGFVEQNEDLADACVRELREETGLVGRPIVQIGAWGQPDRDPRGRNVTIAYLVAVPPGSAARGGDDAKRAVWHPVANSPPLAFDHADILEAGLERLRSLLETSHAVYALLPETFDMEDLRGVLGAVRNELATAEEARRYALRSMIVKEPRETMRDPERCRCIATGWLDPLK